MGGQRNHAPVAVNNSEALEFRWRHMTANVATDPYNNGPIFSTAQALHQLVVFVEQVAPRAFVGEE